jgi:uncharacterized protein
MATSGDGASSRSLVGDDTVKINVSKIPESGMNLQFEKDGEWFRSFLPETERSNLALGTISVTCTVSRMKENVFIEGTAETSAELPCSRCLETARVPVKSSFKYTFSPPPAQPQEEWELSAEDLDFAYYEEDVIDMDLLIFEQIMLQMPIKPLCSETCTGLCPRCGVNLNTATCRCQEETFDERLAPLKQFKVIPTNIREEKRN